MRMRIYSEPTISKAGYFVEPADCKSPYLVRYAFTLWGARLLARRWGKQLARQEPGYSEIIEVGE